MPKPKVLLLENIHFLARDFFIREGFDVDLEKGALSPDELIKKAQGYDLLGIRSKTTIPPEAIEKMKGLKAIGCFCVGTNQVDCESARTQGLPVFNAPFSNTRSVAEMVISEIIMLSRRLGDRNLELHRGEWKKTSNECREIRGKTLGIIGYGNIGTQVSTMAEAMGMRVGFYDILSKLSLGNAKPFSSLQELLAESDFVTLHVPATRLTELLMGDEAIRTMKKGSYLINASRGNVVDLEALAMALEENHLLGAALDVFPEEPETNIPNFHSPEIKRLAILPNVILTPHIGGATEEAQTNIGREVAGTLIRFFKTGSTLGSVNFPSVEIPQAQGKFRLINVHRNVPGVMKEINRIIGDFGANIQQQFLSTDSEIGYLILDLDRDLPANILKEVTDLKTSIQTRVLN